MQISLGAVAAGPRSIVYETHVSPVGPGFNVHDIAVPPWSDCCASTVAPVASSTTSVYVAFLHVGDSVWTSHRRIASAPPNVEYLPSPLTMFVQLGPV